MNNIVLNAVDELILEIKSLPEYKRLLVLKQLIEQDDSLNILIKDFDKWKKKYEATSIYGEHHPDLKSIKIELAKAKEILFQEPLIQEYKSLEKKLQKALDQVSKEIAQAVSPKVRYPNELGLINKH